jgi:hypothetical protein
MQPPPPQTKKQYLFHSESLESRKYFRIKWQYFNLSVGFAICLQPATCNLAVRSVYVIEPIMKGNLYTGSYLHVRNGIVLVQILFKFSESSGDTRDI